jgi:hypothetical protein
MSVTIDRSDPKRLVLAFAEAYTQWEEDMHFARDEVAKTALRDRHAQILLDYCTTKKRSYVDGILSYARPPAYSQITMDSIVHVEASGSSRMHVDTGQLSSHAYRFVLLKKKDGWRIDGIKWRFVSDDVWENTLIGS